MILIYLICIIRVFCCHLILQGNSIENTIKKVIENKVKLGACVWCLCTFCEGINLRNV